MPVPPQVHVAAASDRVAAQLAGPVRRAEVLAAGRDAVYLRDEDVLLAVLSRRATAVPCGLRTGLDHLPEPEPVVLGGGHCRVGGHVVEVARRIDVTAPPMILDHPPAEWDELPGIRAVRDEIEDEALALLAAGDANAVPGLLGHGSGLTPTGDDVVAGWLVTARSAGRAIGPVLEAVRRSAPTRTTPLSAGLLECARRGETIPQMRDLLRALHRGRGVPVALDALLAVGHTSGAAMALGVRLALEPPTPTDILDRRPHR